MVRKHKRELKAREEEIDKLMRQKQETSEDDITISKERHFCLVHKGPIKGHNFICPHCGAYYCLKCYEALTEIENECWSCANPLDAERPIKKEEKDEGENIEVQQEDAQVEAHTDPEIDDSHDPRKGAPPKKGSKDMKKKKVSKSKKKSK